MEIAALFLGALGSGGAAAATSAASWLAGTTVTTAAGVTTSLASSSALSVLQGVATAASMASTIVGGVASLGQAATNAELAELQGQQEYVASEQAAAQIKREMVQKIGASRVAFAGSGLDISSGSAVESDLASQADFATGIERSNGQMRRLQANARARNIRTSGVMDLAGAAAKALGTGADYALDISNRG